MEDSPYGCSMSEIITGHRIIQERWVFKVRELGHRLLGQIWFWILVLPRTCWVTWVNGLPPFAFVSVSIKRAWSFFPLRSYLKYHLFWEPSLSTLWRVNPYFLWPSLFYYLYSTYNFRNYLSSLLFIVLPSLLDCNLHKSRPLTHYILMLYPKFIECTQYISINTDWIHFSQLLQRKATAVKSRIKRS